MEGHALWYYQRFQKETDALATYKPVFVVNPWKELYSYQCDCEQGYSGQYCGINIMTLYKVSGVYMYWYVLKLKSLDKSNTAREREKQVDIAYFNEPCNKLFHLIHCDYIFIPESSRSPDNTTPLAVGVGIASSVVVITVIVVVVIFINRSVVVTVSILHSH